MIPLRDNIPARTVPWVNYLLIAICTVVFALQLMDERTGRWDLTRRWGMIPARVRNPGQPVLARVPVLVQGPYQTTVVYRLVQLPPAAVPEWLTLLTCIFLHGGWLHFLGNMWFLHIFGDNVEDRLGHMGFLVFYLASGVLASAAHLMAHPDSTVPTIGASGAIAGVMGAYMVFYPRAMVLTMIPLFLFFEIVILPAVVFLGLWFVMQFFQGVMSITAGPVGGVAWWAHIGGFVVGMAVAWLLKRTPVVRAEVQQRRPGTERVRAYVYRPRYPMGP